MKPNLYYIKNLEDVVGTCTCIENLDGVQAATIGGVTVAVPYEIVERLKNCIGRRVGILRIDDTFRAKLC